MKKIKISAEKIQKKLIESTGFLVSELVAWLP